MNSEAVLGLANYEVTSIEHSGTVVRISACHLGSSACPNRQGGNGTKARGGASDPRGPYRRGA